METTVKEQIAEVVDKYQETQTRICPLTGKDCIREDCAWFIRNGCAIFHIACAAIEQERMLREKRGYK